MKQLFFLTILSTLLMAASCNRKGNQVITARPAPTATPSVTTNPTVVNKEERRISKIDNISEVSPDETIENERMTSKGRKIMEEREEQRKRIAETGVQEVVAELKQLGCGEGDCPVFTLQILTDNTLRYEGKANVDLVGTFTGTMPLNPMNRLVTLASSGRFFNMKDTYPEKTGDIPADTPAVITSINHLGFKNAVTHYLDGPDSLIKIEDYMRDLVNQATWTEVLPEE